MNMAALLLLLAALLLACGGWLLWRSAQRSEWSGAAAARVESLAGRLPRQPEQRQKARIGIARLRFVGRALHRAGISLAPQTQTALMVAPLAAFPILALALPLAATLAVMLLYPLLLYGVLLWKIARFRRALVEQLPGFLDAVARSLAVGNTMMVAIQLSIEKSQDPVRRVFARVLRRHELGASIEDALAQVARSYGIRELSMLASVVSVNSRWGGKVEPVLGNIATTIREADRARRELFALTAETRFSAWLLSLLPPVVAALMSGANPAYLQGMWQDPAGRWVLLGALLLEVAGAALLFRMSRL